ncbi:hypothetical protein QEZ54_19680 [Catellatospora sp. KI3]|uniref:hypothetical protein n=1 Tax=Catellatospora sp. KI3 TaxID=3041620 RepID=UPI002482E241|nr:hypothetical protein [Catellatospora sp. KI3]MDI1463205.1 hypothetical protein [Catellatospora sp. KI3]
MNEYPAAPGEQPVTPSPKPRRLLWPVLALVGVLAGGGGAAYALSGDETSSDTTPTAWGTPLAPAEPSASSSESPSAAPTASASPSAKPSPSVQPSPTKAALKITLRVPSTLGGLPKSPERPEDLPGMRQRYPQAKWVSASYGKQEDLSAPSIAFQAGTSSKLKSPAQEVEWLWNNATEGEFRAPSSVSTGSLGGKAVCGNHDVLRTAWMCVWADSGSVGVVVLWAYEASEAKSEFVRARAQIERRG